VDIEALKREAREQKSISELKLVKRVAADEVERIELGDGRYEVALVDCGVKRSIIDNLLSRGMNVTIFPFDAPAEEILSRRPDAVLISNGPGDPAAVEETIAEARKLIGKVVLYGICLGHQIIALALGAETYKLKFGHRGLNQPVKDLETGRVFISTQNHGFAVAEGGLERTGLEVTHINLNDNTIEGLKHRELPIRTVQYHPEAGPGPHDTYFFFDFLIKDMENWNAEKS